MKIRNGIILMLLSSFLVMCNTKEPASFKGQPLLLVMGNESNAGGVVPVSELSSVEKSNTPQVQLLDVIQLDGFEDLNIEDNNNRDHEHLAPLVSVGWHTQLANRMRSGSFVPAPLYLVEGGQGGSRIAQWAAGGTYDTKLVNRVDTALHFIRQQTGKQPRIIFLYTHGINDAVNGTPAGIFKTGVIEFINRFRARYGAGIPFLVTELPAAFHGREAEYNAVLQQIAVELPLVELIDTEGAALQDPYHWNKAGMALIVDRFIDHILKDIL